eukprot:4253657-Amphidinium_carterae.1
MIPSQLKGNQIDTHDSRIIGDEMLAKQQASQAAKYYMQVVAVLISKEVLILYNWGTKNHGK